MIYHGFYVTAEPTPPTIVYHGFDLSTEQRQAYTVYDGYNVIVEKLTDDEDDYVEQGDIGC
jgi:hypothetical protein